ncbi:MAG: phosphatidylserine synthase [Marmoricola sp.]|nr:phosphatidylserine synthase [Marmoricola sp.]
MHPVQRGPMVGFGAVLALLGGLDATLGLDVAGWVTGLTCAAVLTGLLSRGLAGYRVDRLGPADRVTLGRAALACGVAALTADSWDHPAPVWPLVAITVVALVLDRVDGWVARRTATASRLGARFDMEVDAFLILVLSVHVARSSGAWVLAIGAARYLLLVAGWLLPWLRGEAPPRPWCKVVAAIQGVVLVCAAAGVLPQVATDAALVVALALLTESFGREAWWLWRHRGLRTRERVLSPQVRVPRTGSDQEVAA